MKNSNFTKKSKKLGSPLKSSRNKSKPREKLMLDSRNVSDIDSHKGNLLFKISRPSVDRNKLPKIKKYGTYNNVLTSRR